MQTIRATICLLFAVISTTAHAQAKPDLEVPIPGDSYSPIPQKFLGEYDVILEPEENEPEWWAGAPSVVRTPEGDFWMACRMRTAESPRGLRGYEIRILHSEDGTNFVLADTIHRDDIPIPGFERPALLRDPDTGMYKLYLCGPWQDQGFMILKLDDAPSPDKFDPTTARAVITPREKTYERDQPPLTYKDPVIIHAQGAYHCYVIGYVRRNERIFHFRSEDGEQWEPVGNPYQPIMDLAGWHDFFVRPASVVPVGVGYLFFYEGSSTTWYDPVYNVVTGVGFTFDLHNITDLTPDAPLVISSTGSERFSTFRYSHWMFVDDQLWVYAEAARPNDSNEIRLIKLAR